MPEQKDIQELLSHEKTKRLFLFTHLNWCKENLETMPNEIHLIDTLGMAGTTTPGLYEGEIYGCSLNMLCAYFILRSAEGGGDMLKACEERLEELKKHADEAKERNNDMFNLVQYYLTSSMRHLLCGEYDLARTSIGEFSSITSNFDREEDTIYTAMINDSLERKAQPDITVYRKRVFDIINEHTAFIYSLLRKSILQMALLSRDGEGNITADIEKIEEIASTDFKGEYEDFIRKMRESM